jgi:hypothetical protein
VVRPFYKQKHTLKKAKTIKNKIIHIFCDHLKNTQMDKSYKSDNEKTKNNETCNFDWYSDGDEEPDFLDFIDSLEKSYTLEELENLEDFKNGKIRLFIENGEVLGYNKEKDVYYRIDVDPSYLVFDF